MDELADLVTPLAVRAAVALGLPDRIANEPVPVEVLAADLGTDAGALARLVRLLATRGIVTVTSDGAVRLAAAGACLVSGTSAAARLDWTGAAGHLDRVFIADLLTVLRTGRSGRDLWAELAEPALGASFDRLMTARSAEWVPSVAELDLWAGVRSVVDVGGGRGHLLRALTARWPHLRGVLVDRSGAADVPAAVEVVAGDFRDPLRAGADVYVLAHVLHDWPDDTARTILRRAAEAAGATGVVLVIERLLDHGGHDAAHQDLRLFVLFGGRERTRAEFESLGRDAGVTLDSARPTQSGRYVLTFRPVPDHEEIPCPRSAG
ncbi:methyltransferase [Amycolatopsis sp. NPDC051903]|uniref:methyltransferase n=1 Tax=Amycolatopsis sp. NPDC051903 TaxID=3363936 RepID=UPI00378BA9D0